MQYLMRVVTITALGAGLALAQESPARVETQFVPIVLDAEKFNELGRALDRISMPNPVYRELVAIFQQLEQQAQLEKTRADAKQRESKKQQEP